MKTKRNRLLFINLFLIVFCMCFVINKINCRESEANIPKEGYVPDEKTAIKIAEAVWTPIYGGKIYAQQPFRAKLSNNKKVWYVEGTFDKKGNIFAKGGHAYAEIQKNDGKILKVYHTK